MLSRLKESRALTTADSLNRLLDGYILDLDIAALAGDVLPLPEGAELSNLVCEGFNFGDIDITSSLNDQVSPQVFSVDLNIEDLEFDCYTSVSIEYYGSLIEGDILLESFGSNVSIPLDFFSEEFGRLIPTALEFDQGVSCFGEEVFQLNMFFFLLFSEAAPTEFFQNICLLLNDTINDLSGILEDNFLVDLGGTRVTQPDNILDGFDLVEIEVGENLPTNFTLLEDSQLDELLISVLQTVLNSEFGLRTIGVILASAGADDLDSIIGFMESYLTITLGTNTTVSEEQAILFNNSGIFDVLGGLLGGGDIDINPLLAGILALYNIQLPSTAELETIFESLPAFLTDLLEPVLEILLDVADLLDGDDSRRRLQSFSIPSTVQELIDLIGNDAIGEFLLQFGADTPIVDFLGDFVTFLTDFVTDLSESLAEGISINDQLPDSLLQVLDLAALLLPDVLGDIVDDIEASNGTLAGLASTINFELELPGFANASLAPFSIALAIDFDFDLSEFGLIEQSSLLLPQINLNSLFVELGLAIVLERNGVVALEDIALIGIDLSLLTQEVLTLGFAFINLIEFQLLDVITVNDLLDSVIDFLLCALSSVGFALTAQKTNADLDASLNSTTGDLDGLAVNLVDVASEMFLPALPAFLENLIFEFVEDAEFISFDNFLGNCYDNQVFTTLAPTTSAPTTAAPTTLSPSTSPITPSPTDSPITSSPTDSPITSSPTESPLTSSPSVSPTQSTIVDDEESGLLEDLDTPILIGAVFGVIAVVAILLAVLIAARSKPPAPPVKDETKEEMDAKLAVEEEVVKEAKVEDTV